MTLFGCKHENVSFPQKGWQRCTDCGARRCYEIGEEPGPWNKQAEPAQPTKQEQPAVTVGVSLT